MDTETTPLNLPLIFDYLDYRKYLKDFYEFQKNNRSGFSFRAFALRANLASPNYLKLVVDGERRITDKTLSSFVKGLRLNKDEEKYFRQLVQFCDSEDPQEKRRIWNELIFARERKTKQAQKLEVHQNEALKSWATWVIREMVKLVDFKPNGHWISNRLQKMISPREAEKKLSVLNEVGLLLKDGEKHIQAAPRVTTNDEVTNYLVRDLHAQFIEVGVRSLFRDPVSAREFSGVTLAVTKEQIPLLKERIKKFRQDINIEFSQDKAPATDVYHLEIMFFPVTASQGEPK